MKAAALEIDHVTIAGSDLSELNECFSSLGMATDYGGPHSNGITHMSLLGLPDGSYAELIATLRPHQFSPWWHEHIEGNGGPCGWAIEVPDVNAESQRVAGLGIAVRGPQHMTRVRPDGRMIEWDMAVLGDGGPGTKLPFIIRDRTPRSYRVSPSATFARGPLTGIAAVVLGVNDMDVSVALFRRLYALPEPSMETNISFGAHLAWFTDTPVVLAAPLQPDHWLAERLSRFGECPCAYLFSTGRFEEAEQVLELADSHEWFGRTVGWFDLGRSHGFHLGVDAD